MNKDLYNLLMFTIITEAEAMEQTSSSYSSQNMTDFVDIPLPEYAEKKTYGSVDNVYHDWDDLNDEEKAQWYNS